jgi:U3 small nucleolar RNA-associated protein 5
MPAPVALHSTRQTGEKSKASRDAALPPAKKTKLSQSAPAPRENGYSALLNGALSKKPAVAATKINRVRNSRKEKVEEATAVVAGGLAGHGDVDMVDAPPQVIEISSAEESSDYSEDEDEDEADTKAGAGETGDVGKTAPVANGHIEGGEDQLAQDGTAEPEELSFGERLQAQEPEPSQQITRVVDVEAAFEDANTDSRTLTTTTKNRTLTAPSASSLGTVLTQALKTNDKDLLDSCLLTSDANTIYATVERLPSPLVGNLLQKLAERLYRKPGRAGFLILWVRWSLAAHGGYLASQPQLVKQLATLNKVLKERASGLQPLLSLKGRLDMLNAQLELRKRYQKRAANDDEEEAVIYVEGEDDVSEDQSQSDDDAAKRKGTQEIGDDDDESSEDEMPTTMEVNEDSEGSEDSDDLLDDEAEETDKDTGDEMSEPMSDDDLDMAVNGDDVSESEVEAKPAVRSAFGRARRQ